MTITDQPKQTPTNRPKVLVVDDEFGPRESLGYALGLHFDVRVVSSGIEAVEIVKEEELAVIVMDIRMPDQCGLTTLEKVREIDPHVAVIMMTGYGTLRSAQHAMEAGANQYLRKPPDVRELVTSVKTQAEAARLRRQEAKANQRIREMLDKLNEERKEASSQIWQGRASVELVHDLANPLTVMIGYANLLREEMERIAAPSDEARELCEYAGIVESAAEYCHHLAENWRQASRSSGEFCDVNLSALASEMKKVIFYDDPAIEIVDTCRAVIRGSRFELARVIQNLTRNAKEAGATRVQMRFLRGPDWLELKVADNGHGMDATTLAESVKGGFSTKANGTGVGLSICRHIAAIHGARLSIESEPGVGSEVRIRFPL